MHVLFFCFTARTSSVATIDSLDDYARYSDDGNRETDEKVAGMSNKSLVLKTCHDCLIKSHSFPHTYYFYFTIVVLEFELRKAHETIKALRGSLTEATGD